MKHARSFAIILAVASAIGLRTAAQSPTALPTPAFHHLHLNSVNPDAAIDF
jgi:hypothetical protein